MKSKVAKVDARADFELQLPVHLHHRKTPPGAYILDANESYIISCSKTRDENYATILDTLMNEMNANQLTLKSQVATRLEELVEEASDITP